MAMDVKATLANIFVTQGQLSSDEAENVIKQMRRTGQLMEEYFG